MAETNDERLYTAADMGDAARLGNAMADRAGAPPAAELDAAAAVRFTSADPWRGEPYEMPKEIIGVGRNRDALLPAGEIALLIGAGGGGKSRLALQIAIRAAVGVLPDGSPVDVFGDPPAGAVPGYVPALSIAAGPVVMIGYEDSAEWITWRARACADHLDRASGNLANPHRHAIVNPDRLSIGCLDYDAPLFGLRPGGGRDAIPGPLAGWDPLWTEARRIGARLVVIDPAALACIVEGYSALPIGLFYAALRREARQLGAGVLIVHHTPKWSRKKGVADDPADSEDAGAIGSVAWTDRARGVLMLQGEDLKVTKANYCRRGPVAIVRSVEDQRCRPVAFETASATNGSKANAPAGAQWTQGGAA